MAACTLALLGVLVPAALAYPDGAPPGHAGGFGEPTCGECHFGGDPPEPEALRLAGLGETFVPGANYELSLRLYLSGMAVGGFQLTARFADGPRRGRSAGRLDGGRGIGSDVDGAVAYFGHTEPARAEGDGKAIDWRLYWSAPEDAHPVVFNVAAVAGNDDLSPIGDIVHELELSLQPRRASP